MTIVREAGQMKRRMLLGAIAGPAIAARPAEAQAPSEAPVTILIGYPPSGPTDTQMRSFAEVASRTLGRSVTIENRPGDFNTRAVAAMRGARPDGTMLAQLNLPGIRLPFLRAGAVDPRIEVTPILGLTGYLFLVGVSPSSSAHSWADLMTIGRERQGGIRFAVQALFSTQQLTIMDLAERERVEVSFRAFPSEDEVLAALSRGEVDAIAGGQALVHFTQEGRMRALNVWTRDRISKLPDVPTLRDLGYDMDVTSPYGLVGPAGIDPAVVSRLHDGFRAALHDPVHRATLERLNMPLVYMDTASFTAWIRQSAMVEEGRVRKHGLRAG